MQILMFLKLNIAIIVTIEQSFYVKKIYVKVSMFSAFYITVSGITILSLKLLGQFLHPYINDQSKCMDRLTL